MAEPHNVFGAIIFWLYIVFALVFIFLAIESILRLPNRVPRKHVATFTVLAFISFSNLSFNMLNVLIDSYSTWSECKLPPARLSLPSLWQWSVTSTLFRNFGEAIVQDEARFLWTQSALMATMSVSFFMSTQGLRQRVPRLWAFFALSQILPISFAQNLFYIALLRSPNVKGSSVVLPRTSTLVILNAYCACLFVAPYTARGPSLMPTILAARLLLFVPSFLSQPLDLKEGRSSSQERAFFTQRQAQLAVAVYAVLMTVKQLASIAFQGFALSQILMALVSHPAVTSLGFDFLVTAISFSTWSFIQDESGQQSISPPKKEE
ncbi:hypothetical protein M409DRAFT_21034 [Zasmidium cellare ATCC 36951]|uniref:Uncharacterized protein n=1 Tax=Zasmidium cellare ATCC 36951 TaxID=1080233 RepID=A0A6A6CQR0_ZASCE|nr:uncharacterized protein M409DRAFT_21034 [Zasmidium cellare ATCC 36951]KAF2169023.1 hypothetical protein M409DRAFT_21034 [Zasmidium cellare ATCC 36951]